MMTTFTILNIHHILLKHKICTPATGRKKPFGRHRHRRNDNFKTDLSEVGFENVKWIHLVEDRGQW